MTAIFSAFWRLIKTHKFAVLFFILLPVLFGLGVYGFLRAESFLTVLALYGWMWGWLHDHLGFDPFLARGVAALCALPLTLILGMMFARDPQVRQKGIVLFSMASVCAFMGMFFMTRDWNFDRASGEPTKWYMETMEGCRFFDAPGYDPETGIMLKPITIEVMKKCEALKGGGEENAKGTTAYFNVRTGEATVSKPKKPTRKELCDAGKVDYVTCRDWGYKN